MVLLCIGAADFDDDFETVPRRTPRRSKVAAVARAATRGSRRAAKRQTSKMEIGQPTRFAHVKHIDSDNIHALATLDFTRMHALVVDHPAYSSDTSSMEYSSNAGGSSTAGPSSNYSEDESSSSRPSSSSSPSTSAESSPRPSLQVLDPRPSVDSNAFVDQPQPRQHRPRSMMVRRKPVPTLLPEELVAAMQSSTLAEEQALAPMDPLLLPLPLSRVSTREMGEAI